MATEDDDEERSLLFSDSEQESTFSNSNSSQHNNHRSNNNINDNNGGENDSDDMEWEDFMIRYWSSSSTAADSDNTQNDDGFEIMTAATSQSALLKIVIMENTDLLPHPLEPELDHDISLLGYYSKNITSVGESSNYLDGCETDGTMLQLLSEAGIQSSLQMAKLLQQDNHQSQIIGSHIGGGSSSSSRQQKKLRQQQLQAEFTIDMTQIPPTRRSCKKPLRRRKKIISGSGKTSSKDIMQAAAVSSSSDDKVQREQGQQQQNTTDAAATLEDSLVAMAQRLSPGNNDNTHHDDHQYDSHQQQKQQKQQQHVRHHSAVTSTTISPIKSSSTNTNVSNDDQLYNWSEKKNDSNLQLSTLPNPNLIHQMGPIQSRTTLRSLLMKKWHTDCWWMHYDRYSILIFRSKDHLDDWVQNPYHGKKEREYLIKLHIDFGDIGGVGGVKSGSGSVNESVASGNNSNSNKDDNGDGGEDGGQTTNILGHRILPIKQKNYGKKSNHNDLYEFKLERWTNMGVSVLAAFASEEMEDVQLLYDTIVEIMERCPHGGLHNIDHMLKK